MHKSKLSSRFVVRSLVLVTVVGALLLIFTTAGTSAAGFSVLNSVKAVLGLSNPVLASSMAQPDQPKAGRAGETQKDPNVAATPDTPAQSGGRGIYRGVTTAVRFDISPPLRTMKNTPMRKEREREEFENRPSGLEGAPGPQDIDRSTQSSLAPAAMPTPIVSFFSTIGCGGCAPPDPVGDVGPNHYVAMGNAQFQIFNKAGTSLNNATNINSLWAGFGGACQTQNAGDPVVIYDQLDDRWILTQFTASAPFFNCVAISTTPDPTGQYFRYAFSTGSNFPDYPKYGMWSDALYISTREFSGGSGGPFAGVGAYAINRAQLVAGIPTAQVVSFLASPASAGGMFNVGDGLLPADLDGSTLPPTGSPNFYVGSMDNGASYGAPQDALTIWKFQVDFTTPANSSFTLANTIPITAFDTVAAFCSGRACIPQPSTTNRVDHLGYRQRPLHRAAYRNFGDHEAIVTNQSVEASATMSGIRWWEIRSPNATPTIFQEGTYAPGITDGTHRWMGSLAMDKDGNMGLGYSASSATVFPSVRYTGRLVDDPAGTMPQGEASIVDGTGSQTAGGSRWGDYSSMNIDPTDDCTFWYVSEYVPTTSGAGWRIRVGSFKFPTCDGGGTPTPTATATPTNTPTNTPTSTPTATSTPGVTPTDDPTPTATPTATPVRIITGTVTYGNSIGVPTPPGVSNALISGAGSPNVSTTTAGPGPTEGRYVLTGFGSGAYTVTPTKTTGQNNITSFDAARIAQHVAGVSPLTGNQLVVADVSGNGTISSFDAAEVAGYVVSVPPTGSTGTWRFVPVNRTYPSVTTTISGQDYSALLMGEVSGNWVNMGSRPDGSRGSSRSGPVRGSDVTAPQIVAPVESAVTVPISIQGAADKGIIAYEFDLRYDPSVIRPQANPVDLVGTVSKRLSVMVGGDDLGLLRVAVYGPRPISGDGILMNLRFMAIGAPGSVSPLTWERVMLNEGDPAATANNGEVELSSTGSPNQAEMSGRLLTPTGEGIPHARVTLIDSTGKTQSMLTNGFGVYRFGGLQVGQTYTLTVESRRYTFRPRTGTVTEQLINVDMVAEQ